MGISAKKLIDHVNGICARFSLDPERIEILINGVQCKTTYIGLEMNDDGAMVDLYDSNGKIIGRSWADEEGNVEELYRCMWIALRQPT